MNQGIPKVVYHPYFPGAPKLLMSLCKWSQYIVEDKVGREGAYLKVMGKLYILLWHVGKSQIAMLYAPGFNFPETSINQG